MNFDWNAEETELRNKVLSVFDEKAQKETSSMGGLELPALKDLVLNYLGRLAKTGYLRLAAGPEKRQEIFTVIAAQNEFAKQASGLFLSVEASTRLFGTVIAGFGGDQIVKEMHGPLAEGRLIGAVAISEPGGEPQTDWQTEGRGRDGLFVVSGKKNFVTNGPIADWIAVAGEVDGKVAFFVVSPEQEGVIIGDRISTMGYEGLAVSDLELNNVEVPSSHVIGPFEDDKALSYLSSVQDLILCSASVGVAKKVLEASNQHSRKYHRGKKPIYAHQEVRFKISDMYTLVQAAELLTYRAGSFFARDEGEADVMVSSAKVFTAEAAEKIANLAMQIMAGTGYISGNPVEQGYREAKYGAIAGTTSEMSRMKIADDILRRFAL